MGSGSSASAQPVTSISEYNTAINMETAKNTNDNDAEVRMASTADQGNKALGHEDNRDENKGTENKDEGKPITNDIGTAKSGAADASEETKAAPVLTPEEIHAECMESLRKRVDQIEALDPDSYISSETGYCVLPVKQLIVSLYKAYFKMKDFSLDIIINHRLEISKLILEKKIVEIWCDIIITSYSKEWKTEDGHIINLVFTPFKLALLCLLNFSDASEDVAIRIANHPGFLEILKQILLDNCEFHLSNSQDDLHATVTKWCNSTVHNISMSESNISHLRRLDFTAVLQPYLQSEDQMFSLNVLSTLAAIIDEKECNIIDANQEKVVFLLNVLELGMNTELRRHNGWSCKECGLSIRMLARNDANKKLLVEVGALELLVKLGKTGNQEEQCESVSAIWALSFDEENRKKIVNPDLGAVDLLLELKQSPNERIKKTCNGALWTLRNELQSSKKYKEIGKVQISPSRKAGGKLPKKKNKIAQEDEKEDNEKEDEKDDGHIMISYQWADQQTLIKIRDRLKSTGHKVWMDIDQMGGSTLQSMAEAVENANIVLMCMSKKYKNSPNCRAEAEYAYQKQKRIIPLKMERGYMPDGWLGFICGAKLFFEFSNKYPFEDKMASLKKEMGIILGQQLEKGEIKPETASIIHHPPALVSSGDLVDSAPVSHPVTMTTKVVPKATVKTLRNWTTNDVQKWIATNDLKLCGLDHVTGGEIAMLMTLRYESPDFFYKCLQDMLKVKDLLTLSKIIWAITDLGET